MKKDTSETKMIIEVGGKQHLAGPGTRIVVNQNDSNEGDTLSAKDLLSNKEVSLKVVKNFLGDKIKGLKFKSKIRYTRRYGHRQHLMLLEVLGDNKAKKTNSNPVEKKAPVEKKTVSAKSKKPTAKKTTAKVGAK